IEEVMEPQTETQIEEVMELQNNEYVDIEDIAMQAETTPDTGTKEIFIILMSLLLGVGYFLLSNKKA
ncbi:MAG: hypothetical protein NWP80_01370, partial [Candidatus Gracilibacteria bacterium]|nr:hypothetical protein [Candidatus Gracilibacteria bacterium]